MGQAKRRGTYEQRKTLAIEKQRKAEIRRKILQTERDHELDMIENNMTPEQKRRRAENHAIISAFSYMPNGYKIFRLIE